MSGALTESRSLAGSTGSRERFDIGGRRANLCRTKKQEDTEQPRTMSNPLQLRQFDPEFLANFQKGLADLLGLESTDTLPPIFKLPVAVALIENAADQLCQRHGIAIHDERVKHVAAAIERYKRRVQYHYAMLKGEAKYDLDMQRAGAITESERDDWQRRFDHLKRQQKIGNRKAQMTAVQRQFSRV